MESKKLKLPILGGSNQQQKYGKFEGFPLMMPFALGSVSYIHPCFVRQPMKGIPAKIARW